MREQLTAAAAVSTAPSLQALAFGVGRPWAAIYLRMAPFQSRRPSRLVLFHVYSGVSLALPDLLGLL